MWAEDKLNFLDRLAPAALTATRRKPGRHYIDLFAGPGLWTPDSSVVPRDSAALRMIEARGFRTSDAFTHATFVNLDHDHAESLRWLVEDRIASGRCHVPAANIRYVTADANRVVSSVMRSIGRFDYALVVADFENASQWPWTSVQAIRAHGPGSVDLYLMMPTHMGLLRMIARDHRKILTCEVALTTFFGCDAWKRIVLAARNDRERSELPHKLEELYIARLRSMGWQYVGVVRKIRRAGRQRLYSMIFATNNEVANRLREWEQDTRPIEQISLL